MQHKIFSMQDVILLILTSAVVGFSIAFMIIYYTLTYGGGCAV